MAFLSVHDAALRLPGNENPLIRDLSFEIGEGQAGLITGPAGSGKTMLGMACCGFLPHLMRGFDLSGSIELDGTPISQGAYRPDIGVVLENPYVQVSGMKRTVRDELAFPLECRGASPGEMLVKVIDAATDLGITHLLDRSVENLSGGELQRVIIAAGLITRPRFLFLDRPLTEIDTGFRATLMGIIGRHLHQAQGAALVAEDPWLLPFDDFDVSIELGEKSQSTVDYNVLRGAVDSGKIRPGEEILSVSSLDFSYEADVPVLEDVSLSLGSGEVAFLAGENGAGKTTLAQIVTGILTADSGRILIDGADAGSMPPWERMTAIGLALQDPGLHFSRATVHEELALSEEWGTSPGEMMEVLGLDSFLDYHPLELTMAGRKRLGMALACGERRKVVILDEPSQYQDFDGFSMIVRSIDRLRKEGKAVLVISHDPRFGEVFPDARTIRLSRPGSR